MFHKNKKKKAGSDFLSNPAKNTRYTFVLVFPNRTQ